MIEDKSSEKNRHNFYCHHCSPYPYRSNVFRMALANYFGIQSDRSFTNPSSAIMDTAEGRGLISISMTIRLGVMCQILVIQMLVFKILFLEARI
jgi:hypothetical protein